MLQQWKKLNTCTIKEALNFVSKTAVITTIFTISVSLITMTQNQTGNQFEITDTKQILNKARCGFQQAPANIVQCVLCSVIMSKITFGISHRIKPACLPAEQ